MSIFRLIFKQKWFLTYLFPECKENATFQTKYQLFIPWYFTESTLDQYGVVCQKWDLYYAEALNSILQKNSRLHRFIHRKNTTVEDQGIITCLSLSPTVVYQNIMFNGNTSPPI